LGPAEDRPHLHHHVTAGAAPGRSRVSCTARAPVAPTLRRGA
jgi:hypothetical protein